MRSSYDVVIIGGGVIGSSVAYHLTRTPEFNLRVAVIERDSTYAISSSSLSTSAIRQQFGTEPNIRMSAYSIDFLRNVRALLSVNGDEPDIALREPGYLILGKPEQVPHFQARVATQLACGVNTELLDPEALRRRFAWLNTDGIGIGAYGPEKEGWFDGPALLQAFRRKARAQGADYINGDVTGLELASPAQVAAVLLANGTRLAAGTVVNAAGAWSGAVARMAGVALPVEPRKRCVFVIDSPHKVPDGPFIFDTSGILMRPEGSLYLCGVTPPTENADDDFGLEVDYSLFDDLIWPALAHRIPGFEQLKMLRAWAGLYDFNVFDHSGIIGWHPERENVMFACGFSGHGMMHSPAAGAAVSELILYRQCRSIDVSPFRFERIAANAPIKEHVY